LDRRQAVSGGRSGKDAILAIRQSKGGKPRHVALTDEGRRFFQGMVAGKAGIARLFERNKIVKHATRKASAETVRAAWTDSDQFRPISAACGAANIKPAVSFHELQHIYAPRLAMRGVPMGVIAAQLGHSNTRMTERHCAHLSLSYVADTVRAAFGKFGIVAEAGLAGSPTFSCSMVMGPERLRLSSSHFK
jgi:integrase